MRISSICWLASTYRALILLGNNYKILVYNLESKSYGNSETTKKHLAMLTSLKLQNLFFS